ncbi:MAG: DUF1127 domain-containing protein [Rhizobiaceae bacterium]|nr:DUF1127 domain-containing protein [Rhizobiaceae bacterium]MCV0406114.1 DUF1127 domain-containing protein [Rhizobiaceae bacterium]
MTMLDQTSLLAPATTRGAFFKRVASNVANALMTWSRAVRNRRAVYRLGELSDWELADIGLTRADLHVVCRSPLGTDPTEQLGSIAAARVLQEDLARRVC